MALNIKRQFHNFSVRSINVGRILENCVPGDIVDFSKALNNYIESRQLPAPTVAHTTGPAYTTGSASTTGPTFTSGPNLLTAARADLTSSVYEFHVESSPEGTKLSSTHTLKFGPHLNNHTAENTPTRHMRHPGVISGIGMEPSKSIGRVNAGVITINSSIQSKYMGEGQVPLRNLYHPPLENRVRPFDANRALAMQHTMKGQPRGSIYILSSPLVGAIESGGLSLPFLTELTSLPVEVLDGNHRLYALKAAEHMATTTIGIDIQVKTHVYKNLTDVEKMIVALQYNKSNRDGGYPLNQIDIARALRRIVCLMCGTYELPMKCPPLFSAVMATVLDCYKVRNDSI